MIFDEADVNILNLTASQFEEACFDLLLSLGYEKVCWRQGGADSGRDIEAEKSIGNSLVGTYYEKWFIECKRYDGGVPPEALNSKIAWADAEKPNHLLILLSSHLTNGANIWLKKIQTQKPYSIHIVDGKSLRKLFSRYPEIMTRHFVSVERKLLLDSRRNWLIHNLIPEAETLQALANSLQFEKLSREELAFLWCSAKLRSDEIERLIEDSEPFSFDHIAKYLMSQANTVDPILAKDNDITPIRYMVRARVIVAELVISVSTKSKIAIYTLTYDSKGEGLEVLVEATGDFNTRVRYIDSNAREVREEVCDLLISKRKT